MLKLLVDAPAMFPPLPSPWIAFEAKAIPWLSMCAFWVVAAKLTWLFAFTAKAAGIAPAATTDSAASKAVVLVDIILFVRFTNTGMV